MWWPKVVTPYGKVVTPYGKVVVKGDSFDLGLPDFQPWEESIQRGQKKADPDMDEGALNTISWYHLRVEVEHFGVTIVDLRSTNGTYVNGRRIAPFRSFKISWRWLPEVDICLAKRCFRVRFVPLTRIIKNGEMRDWVCKPGMFLTYLGHCNTRCVGVVLLETMEAEPANASAAEIGIAEAEPARPSARQVGTAEADLAKGSAEQIGSAEADLADPAVVEVRAPEAHPENIPAAQNSAEQIQ